MTPLDSGQIRRLDDADRKLFAWRHKRRGANGYEVATRYAGACAIETGLVGRLADNECAHDRLPGDRTPPCGCWPQEAAVVTQLPGVDPVDLERAA